MKNFLNENLEQSDVFRYWLEDQGCKIELSAKSYLRNSLGIAPGYDRLKFERDEDATVFLLRWA
jgi:hypothetical protein